MTDNLSDIDLEKMRAALERFQKLAPKVAANPTCKCAGVMHQDNTTGIILCHPAEYPPKGNLAQARYVHLRKYGGVYHIYYVDNRPGNMWNNWFAPDAQFASLFGQNKPAATCSEADLDKTLLNCWNHWCEKNPAPESI